MRLKFRARNFFTRTFELVTSVSTGSGGATSSSREKRSPTGIQSGLWSPRRSRERSSSSCSSMKIPLNTESVLTGSRNFRLQQNKRTFTANGTSGEPAGRPPLPVKKNGWCLTRSIMRLLGPKICMGAVEATSKYGPASRTNLWTVRVSLLLYDKRADDSYGNQKRQQVDVMQRN